MAKVTLNEQAITIREQFGTSRTVAAVKLVAQNAVGRASRHPDGAVTAFVTEGDTSVEVQQALLTSADDGQLVVSGRCACDDPQPCRHLLAVLMTPALRATKAKPAPASPAPIVAPPPSWVSAFAPVTAAFAPPSSARRATRPSSWGLQLSFSDEGGDGVAAVVKPVRRGADGQRWVRGGATWSSWQYGSRAAHLAQLDALLQACNGHGYDSYYGHRDSGGLVLTGRGRHVWELLADASAAGIPVVTGKGGQEPVQVHRTLQAVVSVREQGGELHVSAHVTADGVALPATAAPLGSLDDGAEAVLWSDDGLLSPDPSTSTGPGYHLVGVPRDLGRALPALLSMQPFVVPAADAERFVAQHLATLPPAVHVRTRGAVPPPPGPRLQVSVASPTPDAVEVAWSWDRPRGSRPDPAAEAEVLGAVADRLPDRPGLLRGMDAVRFVTEQLPHLRAVDALDVRDHEVPVYRAATSAPVVTFEASPDADGAADHRDWFDLDVTITVDGQPVPFAVVFTALARGDSHVVLPDGTYFALEHERFAELARLIEESRQLGEGPEGGLRLSRFQAGCWAELERLGVVAGQAREWTANARRIAEAPVVGDVPLPAGLAATLRPYQLGGYGWLATLYANGLGGVLADDMGLGKTLQTLALICHVYEQDPGAAPFLVVAPTSVVGAWQAEAASFAPDLRVVTVTETATRRGSTKIADLAVGAHVVVTSYTLFRLEHDQYAGETWSGLVLDEAQTVKNHQSRAYTCARRLGARFVLAISGTPMENNLMELWAIVSLVAPGLLASPDRFTEYFRQPIEKGHDTDRIAQLRRRIGPLLLRRTKELVAADLPPKQEQVLDVPLAPKHRAAYQSYLQRERRKVLGLLGDMNGNRFEILRSLTVLRQAALDVALVDSEKSGVPATKLDVLTDLVTGIAAEGHRVLVFSQFTRFLRSARDRLTAAGITSCYLDGTTRRRGEVIEEFRTGDASAFLISLKAGGTGLTLTEADYCILLDPWWNPATENQAVDRAHRIGQTRPVMVYRLVAQDTIEEKVMALKAAKAALFAGVLDGGDFTSAALTADDIRSLVQ